MSNELAVKNEQVILNNRLGSKKDLYQEDGFNHLLQIANIFSDSNMIPDAYKNNVADCFIAAQMGAELGISPLTFMQNSYSVHGKIGIEAKLAISLANASGILSGLIEYELKGKGDNLECTASATIKQSGKKISFRLTMQQAIDEGWVNKKGSKWKTIPELMIQYRSAMFLIRTNIPQVIIGLQSKEELIDVYGEPKVKNITPEKEDLSKLEIAEPTMKTPEIIDPPKKEVTGIAEHFNKLGIEKENLEKHLNKDYNDFDEEDIEKLRNIYSSIDKGQMSADDFLEMQK